MLVQVQIGETEIKDIQLIFICVIFVSRKKVQWLKSLSSLGKQAQTSLVINNLKARYAGLLKYFKGVK